MSHLKATALVMAAALLVPVKPTEAQFVYPPTDSRLVIDNVVPLRPAKVLMNMDHDAFSGRLPTGLYYTELLLANYKGSNVPLEVVTILHDKGAYLVLNDAAYDRFKHTHTGNPWKGKIAALQAAGVAFELCAYTSYNNGWLNADLLPGVKVDNDVLLRLIDLTQQGYVQIQP